MSDHGNSMDMPAHRQTYNFFVNLTKYCTIGIIALLIILAITLL